MASTDMLTPLTAGAGEGDVLVPNGGTARGWRCYSGRHGGSWVADVDRRAEGDAQDGKAVHMRTGNAVGRLTPQPRYHRSLVVEHRVDPAIDMSFRVERWDQAAAGAGVKVAVGHQDNLTNTFVMLNADGTVKVFKEARDGIDADRGPYGWTVATGSSSWIPKPGVRHHLHIDVTDGGRTLDVTLDGDRLLHADGITPPIPAGQLGFRLDGVDLTIHSLVIS